VWVATVPKLGLVEMSYVVETRRLLENAGRCRTCVVWMVKRIPIKVELWVVVLGDGDCFKAMIETDG